MSAQAGLHGGFRQSMAWLHTWSGLVVGWLLFAIFLTGTLSFYQDEISVWMQPELHASVPDEHTPERAVARLTTHAAGAQLWSITLPSERDPSVQLAWRMPDAAPGRQGVERAVMDAGTGELIEPRETRGGGFLYRFHFELYGLDRLWARWVVGVATMVMLVGLLTGVVTHKKIFKDFFTFRPGKQQRSWLDAHNATAVLALPFHLIITYSGLLLLMYQLMPWPVDVAYPEDRNAYFAELRSGGGGGGGGRGGGGREGGPARATAAPPAVVPMSPLLPMLEAAARQWPEHGVGSITITQPNTRRATVELRARHGDSLLDRGQQDRLRFSGVTGERISDPDNTATPNAARGLYNSLTALHLLRFADPVLRALFFVAGLMGTAMVATGVLLWFAKRAPERAKRNHTPAGHRLVHSLNVGTLAGMWIAIGAYFWANRLLPVTLPDRSAWEIRVFFLAWGLALLHPWLRPAKRAWTEQLGIGGALFVLAPALSALTTGQHLPGHLLAGHTVVAGVELTLLLTGAGLLWAAWRVQLHRPEVRQSRRNRSAPPSQGIAPSPALSE